RVCKFSELTGHDLSPRDSHFVFRRVGHAGRAEARKIRSAYRDLRVECPRPPLGDITTLMPAKAKPPRLARGLLPCRSVTEPARRLGLGFRPGATPDGRSIRVSS